MGIKGKKGMLLSLSVIAVLIIAGVSSGYVYVGSNEFCAYKCHQMETRAAIWRKSTHKDVKCITCHSEPGVIGELKSHIEGVKYLKSFVKGKTENLTIFATRKNPARLKSCIHCHPADKLSEETETIRIDHNVHIVENENLCTDCHQDMIHGTHSFDVDMSIPKEKNCISCHLREGAVTHCQSCHLRKVVRGQRQLFILDSLNDIGVEPELDH